MLLIGCIFVADRFGLVALIASGYRALAVVFLLVRTAGTTASFAIAANHQRQQLAVLDVVPRGARVVALGGSPCTSRPLRHDHETWGGPS